MVRTVDLDVDGIAYWTTFWADILHKVAPKVTKEGRPCAYYPWVKALRGHMITPDHIARFGLSDQKLHLGLMAFAEDVSMPPWRDERAGLIHFALTFLEADVRLFRSGYAKKNLLNRLRQSPLEGPDIQRIDAFVRRTIVHGTGVEEYRPLCKLVARLVCEGQLRDLPEWLRAQADGAILTLGDVDQEAMNTYFLAERWSASDVEQFFEADSSLNFSSGLVYPKMDQQVPAWKMRNTPEQQQRRNAYRMWRQIENRLRCETGQNGVVHL